MMEEDTPSQPPPFQRIYHPTDLTPENRVAFIHALKLAHLARGELSIMHVDPEVRREDFEDFPHVRPVLEQWGALPPGSTKAQVAELGIVIKKIRSIAKNSAQGILYHLAGHPVDLLVLSTHQREGLDRWRHESIAEPIARQSYAATLFVPQHVRGFIEPDSGQARLRRLLVPVSATTNPQAAVDTAGTLAQLLGCDNLMGIAIHVGDDATLHSIHYPSREGWLWHSMTCQGHVVDVILGMGADFDVDLIVMMTEGHRGLLDMLRGSTTERVLRGARCPLLAVPLHSNTHAGRPTSAG